MRQLNLVLVFGRPACMRRLFGKAAGVCFAASVSLSSPASAATAAFIYDAAGRLVQVIQPDNSNVIYTYDLAGNILSVLKNTSTGLAFASVKPNGAATGTVVTVFGSGFSSTPANNVVRFNGTAATVTAASATQLTTSVPAGATTGSISITVGGSTVSSGQPFSVAAAGTPVIASFNPTIGAAGTAVTITGSNFQTALSDDKLTFGTVQAVTKSATALTLTTAVPLLGASGKIGLSTPNGTAQSSGDFVALPNGVSTTDVVATGRVVVGSTPKSVTIGTNGKFGLILFDGTAGEEIDIGVSSLTFTPSGGYLSISVLAPDGSTLLLCGNTFSSPGSGCAIAPLPVSGTYTLIAQPDSTHKTSFVVTLSDPARSTLLTSATAATTFASTRVGQNATYSFSVLAGQNRSLQWSGATFSGSSALIEVLDSTGAQVAFLPIGASQPNGVVDLINAPRDGTYTVSIRPTAPNTGQVAVRLYAEASYGATIDGAGTSISLSRAQLGSASFVASAGDRVSVSLSNLSTTPSGNPVDWKIVSPSGQPIVTCAQVAAPGGRCDELNNIVLPETGTYRVSINAYQDAGASAVLTVSHMLAGTLATTASSATTFNTTRIGQNGRYTFSATAGQNLSLLLSGATFSDGRFDIYRPDGSLLIGETISSSAPTIREDLFNLPATGVYAVVVHPAGVSVGQVQLRLFEEKSSSAVLNGATVALSLAAGQYGGVTFNGTVGDQISVGLSATTTVPGGSPIDVSVLRPDGTTFVTCATIYESGGRCNELDNLTLPVTGSFRVRFSPQGSASLAGTVTLSRMFVSTLSTTAPSPTSFSTTRVGQNARLTFTATAGQNLSLQWSGTTFGGSSSTVNVLRPDGAVWATQLIDNSSAPSGSLSLNNAYATGTYAVVVDPYADDTGSVGLKLVAAGSTPPSPQTPTAALNVGGTPTSFSITTGNQGLYTFSGTVGQSYGLGMTNIVSTPSGGDVSISLVAPDNITTVVDCGSFYSGNGDCNLPFLPSTGTYTVHVLNDGSSSTITGNLKLTLDSAFTLTAGAASPTTFSTTSAGQNGRFTFNAVAGSNSSLVLSGNTLSANLSIFDSTGALWIESFIDQPSSILALSSAPRTGAYTLVIDPVNGSTGQVGVTLQTALSSTSTVDGTATNVSVVNGQTSESAFTGTTGQRLSIGISSLVTSPTGKNLLLMVTSPQGNVIFDCGSFNVDSNCRLPTLPSTGSYRISIANASTPVSSSYTINVSSTLAYTLTANAASPQTFSTTRPGQAAIFSFVGSTGQDYSLVWSGSSFAGGNTSLTVLDPGGTQIAASSSSSESPDGKLTLPKLSAPGTYTVFVDPPGVSTGQISLSLKQPVSTMLVVGAQPTALSLTTGQDSIASFNGLKGQVIVVRLLNLVTNPAATSISYTVVDSHSNLIATCSSSAVDNCSVGALPNTETYRIRIDLGNASATFRLQVTTF